MNIKIYAKLWKVLPAILLSLSSCTDFLNINPTNRTEEEGYYNSSQRIDQSVIGAYVDLRRALLSNHAFLMYGEARVGDLVVQATHQPLVAAQQLKSNQYEVKQLTDWGYFYDVIKSANDVLAIVADADAEVLSDYSRQLYRGEALALKSIAYFYLTRIWGDVASAEASDFGQKLTADAAIDRAISYARESVNLLPWTLLSDDGIESPGLTAIRFSKTSATLLLAQEELWRKNGPEAYNALQQLFADGISRTGFSLSMGQDRLTTISTTPLSSTMVGMTMDKLNAIYPAADTRRTSLFTLTEGQEMASLIVQDQSMLGLLKVSELELLMSEAAWRSGRFEEAVEHLITASSGATEDYTLLTAETFADALLLERQRQLVGTGQRFFDLLRFGKVSAFVPTLSEVDVQNGAAYWPLSARSMSGNSLSQNSYWSN